MNIMMVLTSNYIINVGVIAWSSAQILKALFTYITTRRIVIERFFGAGGMPSSHSALTCAIAIAMARKVGFSSPEFGLALAFAAVVMYDAMGVRRAAGEQAKVLNKIIFDFPFTALLTRKTGIGSDADSTSEKEDESENGLPLRDKELKEFLGHTPLEVLGGCLLGILVAVVVPVR